MNTFGEVVLHSNHK